MKKALSMKGRKRYVIVLSLIIALIFTSTVASFGASGTKKMTAYNKVVKKGNTAYCADNYAIYKVNLKTGGVKRLTGLNMAGMFGMKLHKGYLYYEWYSNGTPLGLNRVKTNGKNNKMLVMGNEGPMMYAISGKKVYCQYYDGNMKKVRQSMTLKGKNIKKTSTKVKTTYKDSNAKGYTVITNETSGFGSYIDGGTGYAISYLRKPNGKLIRLATYYPTDIEY